jgi:hypothetical protein
MKSTIKLLVVTLLMASVGYTFAAAAKGNDRRIEDRHLSGFHEVSVSGSFDVFITQGTSESVKVEAPDEIINRIITEVDGGVLKIYNKQNFNWNNWFGGSHQKIAIYVVAKDLNNISLSGSGDVYFKEGISTNSLKLSLVGSGDVTGKVSVKTLETRISGSGDIRLAGSADNCSVSIVGSGDYTARGLVTTNCSVRVAGSGDAQVNVSNSLNASVSGSGDVHYTGTAKQIMTSKSGSGDISRN